MLIAGHQMLDSPDNALPVAQGLSDTPVILLLIDQLIHCVHVCVCQGWVMAFCKCHFGFAHMGPHFIL